MKTKHLLLFVAILCSRYGNITPVCAQSTAFTYQGALKSGGTAANGSYDLSFGLYATNSGGSPIVALVTNLATGVSNGLFTTTLDFGGIFTGTNYWLEIGARANGSLSGFTILSPRQPMTATPYALRARTAGTKVYGSFRTHAYWPNFGTASLIFPGGPILFNQNSGLDVTPPSPVVGGITFNNVPDAFIPQISGVTQITVPIAGDYAVTWGHAFQSLGGVRTKLAKNGVLLDDTQIDGAPRQTVTSQTILPLAAGDSLSVIVVNTSFENADTRLGGTFTNSTTAFFTIELLK